MRDAMLKHVLENNLNTPDQHGFTKGRSCITNLLETFESGTEDVDQRHIVTKSRKRGCCRNYLLMEYKIRFRMDG